MPIGCRIVRIRLLVGRIALFIAFQISLPLEVNPLVVFNLLPHKGKQLLPRRQRLCLGLCPREVFSGAAKRPVLFPRRAERLLRRRNVCLRAPKSLFCRLHFPFAALPRLRQRSDFLILRQELPVGRQFFPAQLFVGNIRGKSRLPPPLRLEFLLFGQNLTRLLLPASFPLCGLLRPREFRREHCDFLVLLRPHYDSLLPLPLAFREQLRQLREQFFRRLLSAEHRRAQGFRLALRPELLYAALYLLREPVTSPLTVGAPLFQSVLQSGKALRVKNTAENLLSLLRAREQQL